jgi:hypothetical protein
MGPTRKKSAYSNLFFSIKKKCFFFLDLSPRHNNKIFLFQILTYLKRGEKNPFLPSHFQHPWVEQTNILFRVALCLIYDSAKHELLPFLKLKKIISFKV